MKKPLQAMWQGKEVLLPATQVLSSYVVQEFPQGHSSFLSYHGLLLIQLVKEDAYGPLLTHGYEIYFVYEHGYWKPVIGDTGTRTQGINSSTIQEAIEGVALLEKQTSKEFWDWAISCQVEARLGVQFHLIDLIKLNIL